MAARPGAATFDVIGTTFSLESVRTALIQVGFPSHVLETWFARTLRDGFALAATQTFAPFRALLGYVCRAGDIGRGHSRLQATPRNLSSCRSSSRHRPGRNDAHRDPRLGCARRETRRLDGGIRGPRPAVPWYHGNAECDRRYATRGGEGDNCLSEHGAALTTGHHR